MKSIKYTNKVQTIWENSPYCSCGQQSCNKNSHRLCNVCYETIFYDDYEMMKSQTNSIGAWNIDKISYTSTSGSQKIENLQAVHIYCNNKNK